jgi:crotonobetainyl-CoA:carnitine CoA-transferase CaiB-like acyl-CoA transferase
VPQKIPGALAGKRASLGGVRALDEIINDEHLRDRGFFTEVEHPDLGRRFIYPGGATIYNGSPWRISRRAPPSASITRRFSAENSGAKSRTDPPG